jgi:hypothetical protein
MKLTDYLVKLEKCREEDFDELGVYDNYPVLLSTDISQALLNSGRYFTIRFKERDYIAWREGTVLIQVNPSLQSMTALISANRPDDLVLREHLKFQKAHFFTTLFARPYQEKKIKGISKHQALARVIIDIGKHAIDNKVGLCLPRAVRGDISWRAHPSHIVYSDNLDDEIQALARQQRQLRGKR